MATSNDEAVIVDLHNDLILLVDHFDHRGRPEHFSEFWLPELRAGGVNVQVLPVFVEAQFQSEGALRRTLLLVERIHRLASRHLEVAVCLTGAEITAAVSAGRIAFVIGLEDADVLGLSSLSGAHLEYAEELCELLRENGRDDVLFVVGGTVPPEDAETLKGFGVHEVFGPGTPTARLVEYISHHARRVRLT